MLSLDLDELTSPRHRRLLARCVARVLDELADRRLARLSALDRRGLSPHRQLIRALATRLADVEAPVTAGGVLAVDRLLRSPGSALYRRGRDAGSELAEALARLEPR